MAKSNIPVYLFTGFLEGGKTHIIQESLEDQRFNSGEKTLIIQCEEGEDELDPERFYGKNCRLELIENESDVTKEKLTELAQAHITDRVIIEYNGMWQLSTLFNSLPDNWQIFQQMMFADASTFITYNANMRQLMVDKLLGAEMIVLNRTPKKIDKEEIHKIVRGVSRRTQICYDYPDGHVEYDEIEDPLPFDVNAPVIEIKDEDFALWFRDLSEELKKYNGKTVRVKGLAARNPQLKNNETILGRHIMTCCEADIAYNGVVVVFPKAVGIKTRDWITVTAKIKVESCKLYGGKGPVLYMSMQGQLGTIHAGVKVALKEFYMQGEMKREGGELIDVSPESKVKLYADKFRREATRLAMLSHPNIVRVLEVFEANNTIYYSMEYLSGGSLNDYVTQKGGLPEQEAIGYIRQIGSALMYLHTNKMLHLDIKPSNVMRSDMSGMLKLIDFGLSKQYVENGDPMTSTNLGVGTTGYAPLEQAEPKNEREFSPQLDVYALGATYYKLLTGHTPASAISVLNRGLNTLPLVKKKVSQQSIDAIKAAMEPLQDKRLRSVEAFLSMLPRVDDETIFAPKKKHQYRYWVLLLTLLSVSIIAFDRFLVLHQRNSEEPELPSMESVVVSNFDMPMVRVEGGTFTMGCADTLLADADERPLRRVTVSSYYIGRYEVTQGLWRAVMQGDNVHKSKNDHYPMVNVKWDEIQIFIKRLNTMTGRRFRLPTEAEWEYAARGGNQSRQHPYGGSADLDEVAWHAGNSGDRFHPVGGRKPNELGIYDMSGNVWEYCQDWYGDYEGDELRDPRGASQGFYRVIRGGDWSSTGSACRVTSRQDNSLQNIGAHIGFRLVESL